MRCSSSSLDLGLAYLSGFAGARDPTKGFHDHMSGLHDTGGLAVLSISSWNT